MNSQARIESHHDLQESRAEVALTDLRLELALSPRAVDRAVMLDVERACSRSDQKRPDRRKA